jgi:hypothetical protein
MNSQLYESIIADLKVQQMFEFDWGQAATTGLVAAGLALGSPSRVEAKPSQQVSQSNLNIGNLWKGLIAEDTSGDYQTYLDIASVVRNRGNKGMNTGLVALKRNNLDSFVAKECEYALRAKNINLEELAKKAIREISGGKDTVNGATHYEHTGQYPIPSWAKSMKIVKKVFPGTKKEITFYKS